MTNLNELANEIHAAAVEKGFWDVEDAVIKHLAKMHCELSEAIQEDRMDRPLLYVDDITLEQRITDIAQFDGRKPEGVAVELADFVMMVLDLMAYNGIKLKDDDVQKLFEVEHDEAYENMCNAQLSAIICVMHEYAVDMAMATSAKAFCLLIRSIVGTICNWLERRGVNLWQIVRLKMDYNKGRPKLHGRKY